MSIHATTSPCCHAQEEHHLKVVTVFSLDRSGVNTLPPSEKSLSTAALAGNVVLRDMNATYSETAEKWRLVS